MWRILLVVVVLCGAARADDDENAQKRSELISAIKQLVADIPGKIPGDLDSAVDKAREVKSKLSELASVKGDDSTAEDMVDHWGDYADNFIGAVSPLKQLVLWQERFKDFDSQCQGRDATLRQQIKAFVDAKNTDGITQILPLADQVLSDIKPTWDDGERQNDVNNRAKSDVDSVGLSGDWSNVRDALRSAAQNAKDTWDHHRSDYQRSCQPLLAPRDHPAVVEAMRLLADTKQARDNLIAKLRQEVRQIAADLGGVRDQSDDGKIAGTERTVAQVQSDLGALDPLKGTDPTAGVIATRWADLVRQYLAGEASLRQLKQYQHTLDNGPDKCKQANQQLQTAISTAIQTKDPNGVATITQLAKQLAQPIIDALKAADDTKSKILALRDAARSFAPDDEAWKEVAASMSYDAIDLDTFWEQQLGLAHMSCDSLAKAEQNPDVVQAIATLMDTGKDVMATFMRLSDQWLADGKSCHRLDCDEMALMWDAFCGNDWEPGDDPNKDNGIDLVNDLKSKMRDRMQPVIDKYPQTVAASQSPLANPATQADTQRRLDDLQAEKEKLDRIGAGGAFRGADNPMIQYAIRYGVDQHTRMEGQYGCDVKDEDFGTGDRPDCVVFDRCMIYEFKPDNPRAITKGNAQLTRYKKTVNDYYGDLAKRGRDPDDARLGGPGTIDRLRKAGCVSADGEVSFGTKIETYAMCANNYQCTP
ncbi:MAG: hypothetical protein JO257_08010 [Deltaproteobacteria bacterium]|nr:hypothetical protein [Deltaproteobacteria bacterium]